MIDIKKNKQLFMKFVSTRTQNKNCKIFHLNKHSAFFFFHWHYSPLWALACRTMSFHFFPICHQLSPPSHSQHLKISFYFLFPSFPGSSPSTRPFQFLSEEFFWASYPLPFSPGELTSLSFALLSILLYFLLCSSLLV